MASKRKRKHPIDALYAVIASRRKSDPEKSYTARLLKRGIDQCAKKLGEEGVEAALAAVSKDKRAVRAESADLLYHLLVVWAARGIKPKDVYDELAKREAKSGLAEKASR
jgi:phosphoribosyl-ATP pyrophosphohydrolase